MKIISPSFEIMSPVDGKAVLNHIEKCGRVCYKSEDKITETSAAAFVAGIIKRGHEAVLELKLMQGFPADYIITHDSEGRPYPIKEQVARIGNSVVPIMAKALVQANCPHMIREELSA